MNKNSSFVQLFTANFKMMFRNYRGIFFNLALPILLYVAISKISGFLPGAEGDNFYAAFLLPGLVAMTVMQSGIFSVAYWLIDLRSRGSLKRLLVTPLSPFQMIASVVASRLTLILFQVFLLLLIGFLFFDAQIYGSIIAVIIIILLGGSVFLSVGFLISNLANNYEEAAPMTTIINLVFTFLGNIFFSTQSFPGALKFVSNLLPVTHMSEGIRNNFLNPNWSFVHSLKDISYLLIWLIILLVANALLFKRAKED